MRVEAVMRRERRVMASLRVAMSHAGQWLNDARRVLAHVRAYLDSGQYGECRDSERACPRTCRHGAILTKS